MLSVDTTKMIFSIFLAFVIWDSTMGFARIDPLPKTDVLKSAIVQEQIKSANTIYNYKIDQTGNTTGQHPADVSIHGDPTVDKKLKMKIQTPERTFNLNLERLDKNILHENFKVLNVFTDNTGKTVFNEDSQQHILQEKAKQLHFYHDVLTGTLLSVKKTPLQERGMQHYVEGIIHDDLIIAPPVAHKRHKRSLHNKTHTVWRKAPEVHDFNGDELFLPENIDKLQYSSYYPSDIPSFAKPLNSYKAYNIPYKNKSKSRRKRQINVGIRRIEPELLLFCDNAMVTQFEGDTDELLEYLLHFWHAVNWKFLTISLQRQWPHIDVKIREIGVFRDANAQPFIEENRIRRGSRLFSLYDAMDSLQRWLIKYETVLPLHDIAFLQTGNDACRMTSHTRRFKDSRFPEEDEEEIDGCVAGTAGVAYVRGACLSAPYFRKLAYNFGIGEASTSFNGVIIAAHEVGHLLGAYHDGEAEARGCPSNSGYIMSYSREDAYKFSRFSPCSISSYQNFLKMERSACLKRRGSAEIMKFPTSFPGTYMSVHEQCRRFTGGPPCEIGPKQCEHLCCDDAKGQWRYTRSEPAVDGTSCGTGNVCLNGQCIPLSSFG